MTYQIPPKDKDPIGAQMGEDWYAEAKSLAQFRGHEVEIEV